VPVIWRHQVCINVKYLNFQAIGPALAAHPAARRPPP